MGTETAHTRHIKRLKKNAPDLIKQTLDLETYVLETFQEFFNQLKTNPGKILNTSRGGSGYDLTPNTFFSIRAEMPYRLIDGTIVVRLVSTRKVDDDGSDSTVFAYEKRFPPG